MGRRFRVSRSALRVQILLFALFRIPLCGSFCSVLNFGIYLKLMEMRVSTDCESGLVNAQLSSCHDPA